MNNINIIEIIKNVYGEGEFPKILNFMTSEKSKEEIIFDFLTSGKVRKSGKSNKKYTIPDLNKIRNSINNKEDIKLMLLAFCPKYTNPNYTSNTDVLNVGLEEAVSLYSLGNIAKQCSVLHPTKIYIFIEAYLYECLGCFTQHDTEIYITNLKKLVNDMGEISKYIVLANPLDYMPSNWRYITKLKELNIEIDTNWVEFYKETLDPSRLPNKYSLEEYAIIMAKFYLAFNRIKYEYLFNFPNSWVQATVSSNCGKINFQMIPHENHFSHHGLFVKMIDEKYPHIYKYEDIRNKNIFFNGICYEEYDIENVEYFNNSNISTNEKPFKISSYITGKTYVIKHGNYNNFKHVPDKYNMITCEFNGFYSYEFIEGEELKPCEKNTPHIIDFISEYSREFIITSQNIQDKNLYGDILLNYDVSIFYDNPMLKNIALEIKNTKISELSFKYHGDLNCGNIIKNDIGYHLIDPNERKCGFSTIEFEMSRIILSFGSYFVKGMTESYMIDDSVIRIMSSICDIKLSIRYAILDLAIVVYRKELPESIKNKISIVIEYFIKLLGR